MDNFDLSLKNQVISENWEVPKEFDDTINDVLSHLPKKRTYKRTPLKITIAVAVVAVLTSTTVFASNSSTIKNTINNVIAYFNSHSTSKFSADKDNMEKLNCIVGKSSEDKGIKLTVDSVAVDNNFLDVFYTIESDKPIDKGSNTYYSAYLASPSLYYKINGKAIKSSNNNDMEAYFESDYILKGMKRENLSLTNIPDNFNLEISTDRIFESDGSWNISSTINNMAKNAAKIITPKQKAVIKLKSGTYDISIDKIALSPLGSQIVISEKSLNSSSMLGSNFALLDDNGNSLDVLGSDIKGGNTVNGVSTNAYEFIKANPDLKYLTLIPIENSGSMKPGTIADINKLPINLKLSDSGSLIIDDIVFTKNQIKVTYHRNGITDAKRIWDFQFYDKDGKEVELEKGAVDSTLDRQNGRYTEIYTAYSNSCDFSKIARISVPEYSDFKPLYDQKIRLELAK